jgi:pilus assembly protein CpaE
MTRKLRLVAIASSEESRSCLYKQLQTLDYVTFDGVVLELSDAVQQCMKQPPDVILIDLTGREEDAFLFIGSMSMNPETPLVIFALHRDMKSDIVLEAVRSGAKEFIHYPQEPALLEAALRRHHTILSRVTAEVLSTAAIPVAGGAAGDARPQGKVVSVFSAKGGSGTSTIAVNLAHELKQLTEGAVVLFDMDQVFNNTAVMLNLRPNYSLGDIADAAGIDDGLLRKIVVEHESGIHLVVGSKNVMDENPMVSPELMEQTLDFLRRHYAYIVIDLPTHVLDPYHQFCVENADEVLLVSCLDIPGLYRTRQYLDLAKQHVDAGSLKLVLNRWNLHAAVGMSNRNLEEEFHYPVYARLVNDWELNVEANSLGKVFSRIKPNSELAKGFQKLARQVAGMEPTEAAKTLPDAKAEKKSSGGGLFGKLFNLKAEKPGDVSRHVTRKTELGLQ